MTAQLFIETSTEQAVIAIVDENKHICESALPFGYSSSKFLLPEIEKALKNQGLKIKDLSYIAVGVGPGSYTGIRVGVATAKALAFAKKKPLIGICSLETFVPPNDGPFAVLIDAKIGGAFVIVGSKSGEVIHYISPPSVVTLDKIGSLLLPVKQLITPNPTIIRPKLENLYPENKWEWTQSAPNVQRMAALAESKMSQGTTELEILYLRKTQAEIERENCL